MVHIGSLIPARIRHLLAELLEQPDLRENISKAEWEIIAHRPSLYQFLSLARRALLVKELAGLLSFNFEAGLIPRFDEKWRLEDPIDAVSSTCSSLLAIVDIKGSPVMQFLTSIKELSTPVHLAVFGHFATLGQRCHHQREPGKINSHRIRWRICTSALRL